MTGRDGSWCWRCPFCSLNLTFHAHEQWILSVHRHGVHRHVFYIKISLCQRGCYWLAGDRIFARENDIPDELFHIENQDRCGNRRDHRNPYTWAQSTFSSRITWLLNIATRKGKEVYLMTCGYHCNALSSTSSTCMLCWSPSKFPHGRLAFSQPYLFVWRQNCVPRGSVGMTMILPCHLAIQR
jgi:hypothetical protein